MAPIIPPFSQPSEISCGYTRFIRGALLVFVKMGPAWSLHDVVVDRVLSESAGHLLELGGPVKLAEELSRG